MDFNERGTQVALNAQVVAYASAFVQYVAAVQTLPDIATRSALADQLLAIVDVGLAGKMNAPTCPEATLRATINDSKHHQLEAAGLFQLGASDLQLWIVWSPASFQFLNADACLNHSCEPNAGVCYNDSTTCTLLKLAARSRVQLGDEICVSYIDLQLPVEERRNQLLCRYLFACDCHRCRQEDAKNKDEQPQ